MTASASSVPSAASRRPNGGTRRASPTDAAKVGTLSLNWRYIGATNLTSNSSDPNLAGTPSAFNSRIKAYNYFDLAGTAKVQDGIVFRAGVNNVFDKDPPIIAQAC